MRDLLKTKLLNFRRDERGVTLVEYGIALALAVTFGVAALIALGGDVAGAMTAAGTAMPG